MQVSASLCGTTICGDRALGSGRGYGEFAAPRDRGLSRILQTDFAELSFPRTPVNREEAACFSRAYVAQRSCPARDRLCSLLERSPDRPMAVTTAPTVKAAAEPQITPIKVPRATSPVHHSTPRLTSNDTTKNTTVDNITVPAIFVRILHPIGCVRLCVAPDALRCRTVTHR
jgi:hypothetical protein